MERDARVTESKTHYQKILILSQLTYKLNANPTGIWELGEQGARACPLDQGSPTSCSNHNGMPLTHGEQRPTE